MINWEIDTKGVTFSDIYITKVKETISPYMDIFCIKLNELIIIDKDSLINEMKVMINQLPFLTFMYDKDNFYIKYNKNINIKFSDGFKLIIREIKLNNILNN